MVGWYLVSTNSWLVQHENAHKSYTGDIKLQWGVIFIACETWNIRMQKTWQPTLVLQIMQLRSRGI